MKQSEKYRSRHSMEVPGKSTEVPGKSMEVPGKSTEVPDNCQELPWSRKKPLYGCHENAAWQKESPPDRWWLPYALNARMALRTARTVTPTSAKTASHMVARPKVARMSTATLTPMANQTF